jgi:hypothetical protein
VPTVISQEVIADPVGVIAGLVAGCDPAVDRAVIVKAVEDVAGGRAKSRRLAQALLDSPQVLADGRSPAPRAVADLLIALRKAGATRISPPVCAECGKRLRTFQRRGEDWYCSVCGPAREPCAACGKLRRVRCRDRGGRPRCAQCPPDDGRDPVDLITETVTGTDPALTADQVAEAVLAAVPRAGQRQRLAWVLQDQPDLLTGAGAEAPVPSVLRLIDKLCDAGAQAITHPACPGCGRAIHLHRPIGGQWLCRNCTAKTRARPCSRCGAVREAAIRDEHGKPLCPYCLISDPANQEDCIDCGRRRRVSVRTPDGPLCEACRPVKPMTCSICGREAPCCISLATGQPWCEACRQRWARCAGCGQDRPVRGGTLGQPLCAACTRDDPGFWRSCPDCGQPGLIREPVLLPEPLAALVRQVAATRKGHATIGSPGASPWLFPGGRPGSALSAFRMAERLNQLGIRLGQSRSAALFQLATDLPAAILAEMLGIHIAVAVSWQRASAGDWAAYAAEVSRRPERT